MYLCVKISVKVKQSSNIVHCGVNKSSFLCVFYSTLLNQQVLNVRCDIPVVYQLQCRNKCEQQS